MNETVQKKRQHFFSKGCLKILNHHLPAYDHFCKFLSIKKKNYSKLMNRNIYKTMIYAMTVGFILVCFGLVLLYLFGPIN